MELGIGEAGLVNRRDVLVAMGALAAMGSAGRAQVGVASGGPGAETDKAGGDLAGGARVFALSGVVPTRAANGSERIGGPQGVLATGERVSIHESFAPPGLPPAPLHAIEHSEMIVVMEGEVEFVRDGGAERAQTGDVIYVAYGTHHAIRNTGAGMARYLVLQVGGDTK